MNWLWGGDWERSRGRVGQREGPRQVAAKFLMYFFGILKEKFLPQLLIFKNTKVHFISL